MACGLLANCLAQQSLRAELACPPSVKRKFEAPRHEDAGDVRKIQGERCRTAKESQEEAEVMRL
jgi:hypothetical protein